MTTSSDTSNLNYPVLRGLGDAANALSLADRTTLLKALGLASRARSLPVSSKH